MTNSVKDLVEAAKRDLRHSTAASIAALVEAISAVESEGDGWIEIKGMRDIPVGEDHLLLLGGEREGERVIGYWNRLTRGWMVNRVSDSDLVVTHYQPLPAPPTKEAR